MNERNILKSAQNMSEKLNACAEEAKVRFRSKRGEEIKLPGYIRLMYSAAKVINETCVYIQEKDRKLDKAVAALVKMASCETCKNGNAKKCPIKNECGKEHCLYEFDFE